jgi:Immunity protein 42
MIVGDPSLFAVESGISLAYERPSLRALGFFIIHVCGRTYGQCAPDSTMLACSFDAVETRIGDRGRHAAPFADEPDAGRIADAVRRALYDEGQEAGGLGGLARAELAEMVYARHLVWAPDGDEAFDDGSYVLQFDAEDRVRLIAFRCSEGYFHDPATLSDLWLPADEFYCTLQQWAVAFEDEWKSLPKIPSVEVFRDGDPEDGGT